MAGASDPEDQVQRLPPGEALAAALASGDYDYLDVGCSQASSPSISRLLGLGRGFAIDPDPAKVARARQSGFDAMVAGPADLAGLKRDVRVVILAHVLPGLASRGEVRRLLHQAIAAAREGVVVVQPFFDADPRLAAQGFKLYSSDWSRSTTLPTSFDLWQAARELVDTEGGMLSLFGRKAISDSRHPAILPLATPADSQRRDAQDMSGSSPTVFDYPVYEELVAIFARRTKGAAVQPRWLELIVGLGLCQEIATFRPEPRPAPAPVHLDTGEPAPSTLDPTPAAGTPSRGLLFVCGVPRSGTTALARLLNRHPAIALGVERYRHLAMHAPSGLSRELFERERFLDFQEGDGARDVWEKYQDEYALVRRKWDGCTLVGDKVPRLYVHAETMLRDLPEARFIFISRELEPVRASWQRRADDPDDISWPASNDAAAAVDEWESGTSIAHKLAAAWPERFILVRYRDLFFGEASGFLPLFKWLGLTSPEGFAEAYAELAGSEDRDSRARPSGPGPTRPC